MAICDVPDMTQRRQRRWHCRAFHHRVGHNRKHGSEYGATIEFSNPDEETLAFLRGAGRSDELCEVFYNYHKAQSFCGISRKGEIAQDSFRASLGLTNPPMIAQMTSSLSVAPCLLIVDDDDSVREVFRCILQNQYRIIEASGVDEALSLIDRECPDLVTLDIRMPEKDGLEGLRLIRERNENLPIVMIAGFGSMDTACETLRLGASDYLKKPCGPNQLLTSIRKNLEKSQHCHRPSALSHM